MKLKDILEEGKSLLSKSKIEDAEYDATEILLNLLDMDMARFLFECEDDLEKKYGTSSISNLISDFDELINARAKHYPLQYILGETYFMGLRLNVDRDVLIPRADTEILVEKVMADNQDKNISILDMCTGSGCIASASCPKGIYGYWKSSNAPFCNGAHGSWTSNSSSSSGGNNNWYANNSYNTSNNSYSNNTWSNDNSWSGGGDSYSNGGGTW